MLRTALSLTCALPLSLHLLRTKKKWPISWFLLYHSNMGFLQGGPFWQVPTGRRDGVISNLVEARNQIPAPFDNFTTLQTKFANQGLDQKDLVLLSGIYIKQFPYHYFLPIMHTKFFASNHQRFKRLQHYSSITYLIRYH